MDTSLDEDEVEGQASRGRVWLTATAIAIGIATATAVPALIWAGNTSTEVQNLKVQRDGDRRETREDLQSLRTDVREVSRKVDVLLERGR